MLRHLWWPDGDLNSKLQSYRMKVHVFGTISSPSCLNYVMKHIAYNYENTKPKASNAILNAFYVDVDGVLSSFATEEEAIMNMSKCSQEKRAERGFRLMVAQQQKESNRSFARRKGGQRSQRDRYQVGQPSFSMFRQSIRSKMGC